MRGLIVGFAVLGILLINGIKTAGFLAVAFILATIVGTVVIPGKKQRRRMKRKAKRMIRKAIRIAGRAVIYGIQCL